MYEKVTMTCMFCTDGCKFCTGEPVYPEWFTLNKELPNQSRNVLAGLHPTGQRLDTSNLIKRCGSCAWLIQERHHDKTYYKCHRLKQSRSLATDVRIKWRGCEHWKVSINDK